MRTTRLNIAASFLCAALIFATALTVNAQSMSQIESGRVTLPNGWKLTPAGKMMPLGDLPLNMAVSPSGKFLAVTNNGQSDQSIHLIDPA
ncbi:MAG TPA: hypothetical protein VN249_02930, partial [Prolixibacteraceae bacterium]|nr:hypothetical protein [Prolixibacteraceae bacterium]